MGTEGWKRSSEEGTKREEKETEKGREKIKQTKNTKRNVRGIMEEREEKGRWTGERREGTGRIRGKGEGISGDWGMEEVGGKEGDERGGEGSGKGTGKDKTKERKK